VLGCWAAGLKGYFIPLSFFAVFRVKKGEKRGRVDLGSRAWYD